MTGFAAIHRKALEHPLLNDAARLGAWTWLILQAAWKPTPYDINGKIVTLDRGQICVSRAQLAKAWGMSPSAVERFLTRLETEQMIGRATGQGKSIITISNYDTYQTKSDEAGQAVGQPTGQQSDSNRTTKEQGNKGTIVEEEADASPSTGRARRDAFPRPDWASEQVWADLKANRRAKHLPCTATAHAKLLRDIDKLTDEDWPPGRLLEAIVARGWAAAYDPRDDRKPANDRTRSSSPQRRRTGDGSLDYLSGRIEAGRAARAADPAGRHDAGASGDAGEFAFAPPASD